MAEFCILCEEPLKFLTPDAEDPDVVEVDCHNCELNYLVDGRVFEIIGLSREIEVIRRLRIMARAENKLGNKLEISRALVEAIRKEVKKA